MCTVRTLSTRWLAWSLFALTVALSICFLPLFVAVTRAASAPGAPFPPAAVAQLKLPTLGWLEIVLLIVACWVFSALGAVIVSRYPAHTIGWIFCAIGFQTIVEPFTGYYAIYT